MNSFKNRTTLGLTTLEAREVPAALASFNAVTGALSVTIDNNVATGQGVVLGEFYGKVSLNGRTDILPGGRSVASQAVRSITVTGSRFDNGIDLSGVNTRGYAGLDGRVTVDGGDGMDRIHGSAFGDVLKGGNGADRLLGLGGNDTLSGGSGNDDLQGGIDDDRLDGGAGDDNLTGGAGADIYIGGAGFDVAWGFNREDKSKTGIERG